MEWTLQWGKHADTLLKASEGGELSPSLKSKPEMSMWGRPYWDAFHALSGSRNWTMGGPAPIPYPFISSYLDENLITDLNEREEYRHVVQRLDNAYLDYHAKKLDKKVAS